MLCHRPKAKGLTFGVMPSYMSGARISCNIYIYIYIHIYIYVSYIHTYITHSYLHIVNTSTSQTVRGLYHTLRLGLFFAHVLRSLISSVALPGSTSVAPHRGDQRQRQLLRELRVLRGPQARGMARGSWHQGLSGDYTNGQRQRGELRMLAFRFPIQLRAEGKGNTLAVCSLLETLPPRIKMLLDSYAWMCFCLWVCGGLLGVRSSPAENEILSASTFLALPWALALLLSGCCAASPLAKPSSGKS